MLEIFDAVNYLLVYLMHIKWVQSHNMIIGKQAKKKTSKIVCCKIKVQHIFSHAAPDGKTVSIFIEECFRALFW